MKAIQLNPRIIESLSYILNMFYVIYFYWIFPNTSYGIYSMLKDSKYTAVLLLINNETQCFSLLYFSPTFMACAPHSMLGKLCLEKTPLNLGS